MAVKFGNNAATLLASNASSSATVLTVSDGSVFPTLSGADYTYVTLEDVNSNREIVKLTAISGNELTVVRAQDGSSARAFSASDKCELRITAALLNAVSTETVNGTSARFKFTATANQTTFSGSDDNSVTLAYNVGYIDLYLSGIRLIAGSDYTASNGTSIVLAAGASVNDIIEVVSYGTFVLADIAINDMTDVNTAGIADGSILAYDNTDSRFEKSTILSQSSSGIAVVGNVVVSGTVDGRDVATDGTKLDGVEASADVTDTANVTAAGALMDSELTSIASVKALNQGLATGNSPTFVNVTATSLDISGNIDVDGVTNLDVVDIDGAVDMASTLAVGGVLTANAGVVVDNITIDGNEIDVGSGDLTLDVAGDIILDADGGDIQLKDAGVATGRLGLENGDLNIASMRQDYDIKFKGMDGNTTPFTALTLDMSAAGAATFNAGVTTTDINLGTSTGQKLLMYANSNIKYGMSIETSEYRMFAEDQAVLTFGHMARSNGTTYTERMRIDSSGRVEVKGGQELRVYRGDNATYGSMKYLTGSGGLQFNDQNNDGISFVRAGSTENMRIASSGNVGIGTASPSAKLHVEGDGSYITQRGYGQILDLGNWTNGLVRIESTGAPLYIAAAGAHYMDFATNGVGRLRISSSGNVSITADLTVGNSYLSSNYAQFANMRVNNNAYIGSENTPSAVQIQSGGAVAFGYAISAPSAQFTPSSGETVVINRDGAGPYFGTSSNHTLRLITNNTERLRISSGGVVTMPYQPSFSAYGNATGVAYSTTTTVLPYNTAAYNIGSHFSNSTHRFTAPVAGTYSFSASFLNYPTANTSYCTMWISRNGGNYTSSNPMSRQTNTSQQTQYVHGEMHLSINDWVDVRIATGSGGGAYYTGGGHAHFSGFLIG